PHDGHPRLDAHRKSAFVVGDIDADHTLAAVTTLIPYSHLDENGVEFPRTDSDRLPLQHLNGHRVPFRLVVPVEAEGRARLQVEGADEVDEGQLVQRLVRWARPAPAV